MDQRPLVEWRIFNVGIFLDVFCGLDDFFRLTKKSGFWVFLVHPTVVSVLLSASVERCFVSCMRDLKTGVRPTTKNFFDFFIAEKKIPHTGDKASLDRCGQQHRCRRRVDQGKISKKKLFFAILDHFQTKMFKCQTTFSITFPQGFRISKNIGHPTGGSGGKKTVKRYLKSGKSEEKKAFFARRFETIFKQKCSYLRPLLSITFPQGFRISKNIGHPTSGSGGKKTVKRYLKVKKVKKKNFFLHGDFRQFSNKNVHI